MKQKYSNDLSHHILPNSSTMVGVCIMVITIVKTLPPDFVHYLIDEALAIISVVFMVSALLSFLSIRANYHSQTRNLCGNPILDWTWIHDNYYLSFII